MKLSHRLLGGAISSALFLSGCGTGGNNVDNGFTANSNASNGGSGFVVVESQAIQRDGDIADTVELTALDAHGNIVEGPVTQPFSHLIQFPALPIAATQVELVYLRNASFPIEEADFNVVSGQNEVDDPPVHEVAAPVSNWQLQAQQDGGFKLQLKIDGKVKNPDFKIKGVCYSPTPINVQGDGAPSIGDFFFDTVLDNNQKPAFFNWFSLWGEGQLFGNFFARQDIGKIRDLGCNTIRTYSMISRQQNDVFTHPELQEFPSPPNSGYHFTHKQFLDACWNNGHNPVYVIVGIPMPPDNLYLSINKNLPAKTAFFEYVLQETAKDLADHPAVVGFTITNEVNDGPNAYPGTGQGGVMQADHTETAVQNANSDFYWGQIKKYSDTVKHNAPDKLVGFCLHDFREIAQYGGSVPTTGPTYLAQASNLDFAGIDTYQTVNYDSQFVTGWGGVTGASRKAFLFTELGFPATTRIGTDPTTITETVESRTKTSKLVKQMLPQAYTNSACLGACYFEFSDEWWKQKENKDNNQKQITNVWFGGPQNDGFPNGWADEEGFGLYSIKRGGTFKNTDPVVTASGPIVPVDVLTKRSEITDVVTAIFKAIK